MRQFHDSALRNADLRLCKMRQLHLAVQNSRHASPANAHKGGWRAMRPLRREAIPTFLFLHTRPWHTRLQATVVTRRHVLREPQCRKFSVCVFLFLVL